MRARNSVGGAARKPLRLRLSTNPSTSCAALLPLTNHFLEGCCPGLLPAPPVLPLQVLLLSDVTHSSRAARHMRASVAKQDGLCLLGLRQTTRGEVCLLCVQGQGNPIRPFSPHTHTTWLCVPLHSSHRHSAGQQPAVSPPVQAYASPMALSHDHL